jgi:pimeloyl-ACP methyl ester carboxylesterase
VTGGLGELRLASIKSRYVGGRRVTLRNAEARTVKLSSALPAYHYDGNDTYHVEQAYLQDFVPATQRYDDPLILVHGGGLTGACWETTPDGRSGWLSYFLRAGARVVVLDNVERGRASWCSLPGVWPDAPILRGEREMWEIFRIGPFAQYGERIPFPGSRFPVDSLDAMLCQSVPRWPSNADLAAQTLAGVVQDIGRCVLIGHSQGGGLVARVALEYPELVRAVVLVEPHGLPAISKDHSVHPPALVVIGDFISAVPMWVALVQEMQDYATAVRKIGAGIDVLDLPAMEIAGNSHNPMMDTNSDEIAAMIWEWIRKQESR